MATTFLEISNNAIGTLAADVTAGALSLTLETGDGANFPASGPSQISIDNEIIQFGVRAGDVLSSLIRGQEGTTAAVHTATTEVQGRLTIKHITDLNTAVNAVESGAPNAHKDSHDPEDGSDKLDTATAVDIGTASGVGSSHSLARADHPHGHPSGLGPELHQIQHAALIGLSAEGAAVNPGGDERIDVVGGTGIVSDTPSANKVRLQHDTVASGDLHPEYQKESEQNALGGYGSAVGEVHIVMTRNQSF